MKNKDRNTLSCKRTCGQKTTPARITLTWLLARVPILGTKKFERLQENIGAEDITFTPNELTDIKKKTH